MFAIKKYLRNIFTNNELNIKLGVKLLIQGGMLHGIKSFVGRVRGFYESPNKLKDKLVVYVHKSDLDKKLGDGFVHEYAVLFNDFDLVACGGYGINKSQTKAGLSWGLVHSVHHNLGYGSYLLKYRLNEIRNNYLDIKIHLDTSQHTYRFFQKFGFSVNQISKNGYGEGLDKYDMILKEYSKL